MEVVLKCPHGHYIFNSMHIQPEHESSKHPLLVGKQHTCIVMHCQRLVDSVYICQVGRVNHLVIHSAGVQIEAVLLQASY